MKVYIEILKKIEKIQDEYHSVPFTTSLEELLTTNCTSTYLEPE